MLLCSVLTPALISTPLLVWFLALTFAFNRRHGARYPTTGAGPAEFARGIIGREGFRGCVFGPLFDP